MPFNGTILKVAICSPGGLNAERKIAEQAVHEWTRAHLDEEHIVLVPVLWEGVVPTFAGTDGQSILNRELIDQASIFLVFFGSRLGSPTPRNPHSGTAEELYRGAGRDLPVHVWFKAGVEPSFSAPRKEHEDYEAVLAFQRVLRGQALYGSFSTKANFKEQIKDALTQDVIRFKAKHPKHNGETLEAMSAHSNLVGRNDWSFQMSKDTQGLATGIRVTNERIPVARYISIEVQDDEGKQLSVDPSTRVPILEKGEGFTFKLEPSELHGQTAVGILNWFSEGDGAQRKFTVDRLEGRGKPPATPVLSFEDGKIVVRNNSDDYDIEDIDMRLADDRGQVFEGWFGPKPLGYLAARSSVTYGVEMAGHESAQQKATVKWSVNGQPYNNKQTVYLA